MASSTTSIASRTGTMVTMPMHTCATRHQHASTGTEHHTAHGLCVRTLTRSDGDNGNDWEVKGLNRPPPMPNIAASARDLTRPREPDGVLSVAAAKSMRRA